MYLWYVLEKDIQMGDEMRDVKLWHIKVNSMSCVQGVTTEGCEIFTLMGNLINQLESERFTYDHNIKSFFELIIKIYRYVLDYLV